MEPSTLFEYAQTVPGSEPEPASLFGCSLKRRAAYRAWRAFALSAMSAFVLPNLRRRIAGTTARIQLAI